LKFPTRCSPLDIHSSRARRSRSIAVTQVLSPLLPSAIKCQALVTERSSSPGHGIKSGYLRVTNHVENSMSSPRRLNCGTPTFVMDMSRFHGHLTRRSDKGIDLIHSCPYRLCQVSARVSSSESLGLWGFGQNCPVLVRSELHLV
jgi:hypothetical protein